MQKLFPVVAIFLVTICSLRADPFLLPAEGTKEYQTTETSTHVEGSTRSLVTVRAEKQMFEEKEVVKLETVSKEAVVKTELVRVENDDLVCLARAGADGKIVKLNPPEIIVSSPLRVGAKWNQEGEAAGIRMRQRWTVVAEEAVTVPASQFQAFHLRCEDSSLMSVKVDRWFVPGIGIVKEVTVVRGPGVLHRVTLELQKVTDSKPELPATAPVPQPPAQSSASLQLIPGTSPSGTAAIAQPAPTQASKQLTVEVSSDPAGGLQTEFKSNVANVYVRWQGHGLPEGATVRVAWVAEDVGDLVEPNFIVDETETVAAAPDAKARFTLSRPPDGWAEGKYRVEFYVNEGLTEIVHVTIGK